MLNAGFCGSGIFAQKCLEIISERFRVSWVLTNAPRASGRGLQLHKTAVQKAAEQLGIACRTTEKLSRDAETADWIAAQKPDIIFVIDFGHIIKEPLLSLPRLGCINIHPSKLPMYRGSSPLQRTLMDGLTKSAVSIFRLDAGMDTGDILSQPEIDISADETYESLLEKCAKTGSDELLHFLLEVPEHDWHFTKQKESNVSYASKIEKHEGKIDWNITAHACDCLVRAISEAPGVFCFNGQKRLRVFELSVVKSISKAQPGTIILFDKGFPVVACGENAVKLLTVQPDGRQRQSAADWIRGARLEAGSILL